MGLCEPQQLVEGVAAARQTSDAAVEVGDLAAELFGEDPIAVARPGVDAATIPGSTHAASVQGVSVSMSRPILACDGPRSNWGTQMSTRLLADSIHTSVIDVPAHRVDIGDWLFSLSEAEYRRCCPPDHITTGIGATEDGRPLWIGVEMLGDALMIHHFVGEVTSPHHCRLVSRSEAVSAAGRTTVGVTWELRAEPTDDSRCRIADRIAVVPTGDYFTYLTEHGITFEEAAASSHAACNDHGRREAPLVAASIARRASSPNGRHAADSLAAMSMTNGFDGKAAKAVVRLNVEGVYGNGDFAVFDELFADDYVDHTPQPGLTPDKSGTRLLYQSLRAAFPDFRADIHWQSVDGDLVTTYMTYRGTHRGALLGVEPSNRAVAFDTVDVMRVRDGKIVEHWGGANLQALLHQLDASDIEP